MLVWLMHQTLTNTFVCTWCLSNWKHPCSLRLQNASCHRVRLYSSTQFCSISPFGITTNVKHPSFSSKPSGSPSFAFAALQTSLNDIFLPTLSSRFLLVI